MTTYYAAGPAGAGLIEHLLNEINWLRATVDKLTERHGPQRDLDQLTHEGKLTRPEKTPDPDELDGYATGYVDGLAAHETAGNVTVLPSPGTVAAMRRLAQKTTLTSEAEVYDIAHRLSRRLAGPESSR